MSQHTSKLAVIYPQSISTIQKLSKNARNERIDELLRWDNILNVLILLVNIEAHFCEFEINQKHVFGHHSKFQHNNDA